MKARSALAPIALLGIAAFAGMSPALAATPLSCGKQIAEVQTAWNRMQMGTKPMSVGSWPAYEAVLHKAKTLCKEGKEEEATVQLDIIRAHLGMKAEAGKQGELRR